MASFSEFKAAVLAAVQEAKEDITAALVKEKGEIIEQVQELKRIIAEGGTVSPGDFDEIINGIGSIGSSAAQAIDTISVESGAGPNPNPNPNPNPQP